MRLAVALGGTSYAAIKLPRNSVGTKQLQEDSTAGPHALRLNRLPTTSSACASSGAGSRSSKQA